MDETGAETIPSQPSVGSPSSATTGKRLPQWTSSRCPTITFGVLYCFFVISHDRRRILHFNVTKHPTSSWIIQQLREAFPFESAPRFLIFDRDAKYGLEVPAAVRSLKRESCPHFVAKSLAEWSRRALGRELPDVIYWITSLR